MSKPQKTQGKKPAQDAFVSDEVAAGGSSSYLKVQKGETKVRIISRPIEGWVEWVDKKPYRTSLEDEPEAQDSENPPKKFLAVVVIDHSDDEVKIWEITQKSVMKAIKALAANPDWGLPFSYDITITKTGEDLKTKYQITPSPKRPLSKELIKAANEKPCNLLELYEGNDPWEDPDPKTEYVLNAK